MKMIVSYLHYVICCMLLVFKSYCFFRVTCSKKLPKGVLIKKFSERAFDIIFKSTFNKEIGLQFFMNLLSLSFFFN